MGIKHMMSSIILYSNAVTLFYMSGVQGLIVTTEKWYVQAT